MGSPNAQGYASTAAYKAGAAYATFFQDFLLNLGDAAYITVRLIGRKIRYMCPDATTSGASRT